MEIVSSVVTPSTSLPIDLAWARTHLKSISGEEDDLIISWIAAATQYFQEYTSRPPMIETREAWLDAFPIERTIELPNPPLVEVVSVKYVSGDGTIIDFSDGSPAVPSWQTRSPLGVYARRGWVELKDGVQWPTARGDSGSVRIQYRAGYADDVSEVPDMIRAALLLLVGSFERFRSETYVAEGGSISRLPFGVDQMLLAFKNTALASQVLHRL